MHKAADNKDGAFSLDLSGSVRGLLVLLLAVVAAGLATAPNSSAAYLHPKPVKEFGYDGTANTFFGWHATGEIEYDAADKRLYLQRPFLYAIGNDNPPQVPRGIYGFNTSIPGTYDPLGGQFPIPIFAPNGYGNISLTPDETTGNLYYGEGTADPSVTTLYSWDPEGTMREGFPTTIAHRGDAAFDPRGYLWINAYFEKKLYKYDPETLTVLETVDLSGLPWSFFFISFDKATEDIWLESNGTVVKLLAATNYTAHEPLITVGFFGERGFAFDSEHHLFYLQEGGRVGAYNENGGLIEYFGTGGEYEWFDAIAVNEETGDVYVPDSQTYPPSGFPQEEEKATRGVIRVWGGVVIPDVTTGAPSSVGHTTVTVTGHVDPAGGPAVTKCNFEYGTSTEYSSGSVPCVPAATPGSPITAGTDVTAELSGLTTGTTYHYRLVAGNSNGDNLGVDETVTPQPSLTVTGAATNVQRTSATLNGTVDPEGLETKFFYEYGRTRAYDQTSTPPPGEDVGTTEAGAKPVSAPIAGLDPGFTYHYRLVAINEKGTSYGLDRTFATSPAVKGATTDPATEIHRTDVTLNGTLDPDGLPTTYLFEWGINRRYGHTSAAPPGTPLGTTEAGDKHVSFVAEGLKPETTYHYRIAATNSFGTTYANDRTFTTLPSVKDLSTEPATDVTTTSATLNATLDPDGYATKFYFQWGKTSFYTHTTAAPPGNDVGTSAPGALALSAALENLEPGTTYHYRVVASNSFGTTLGKDVSFSTPQAPSVEGFFSANVTADSADLKARINPHGFETTYRFEYGTTTLYGSVAPIPDGVLGPQTTGQAVTASLSGLRTVTYHFRVVAENQWGTTTTEDQTFDFNPPNCPNAALRQQTGAAYLPDCRAYELVSPARAGGTALFARGPVAPYGNDHFAFVGLFSAIPGSGEPINGGVLPHPDLYVASRTASGWVTRYIGLSGDESLQQGGLPIASDVYYDANSIFSNEDMTRLLTWDTSPAGFSLAPYVWDNESNPYGRLPTNLEEVDGAAEPGSFTGDARPSKDLKHYVFSSLRIAFAEGGLTETPGSVYDNDVSEGTVTLVSKTPAGANIPKDGIGGTSNEFIRVAAVSDDGSHILMTTNGPGGTTHLYMRVGHSISYDVSLGQDGLNHGVAYDEMTVDGSAVYFTTPLQLTPDDEDTSTDLYRWSENGGSPEVTRISTGVAGAGNTDACNPGWTTKCDVEVVPISLAGHETAQSQRTAMASRSGDIYLYSPEQLSAGARGTPDQRNLYVWRNGSLHFVATLEPLGDVEQANVSPDGLHVAFITKSKLTPYDNAGHAEMYTYDPEKAKLLCVSCKPDGSPPTSDVSGSQHGLFLTDDGRAFFSTADALVPRDANGLTDVYEFVDGRAQLISTGTGTDPGERMRPLGLIGVSADGTNVFFSTYQSLTGQDENGSFYKFYDARVSGGFPFNKPAAPCAAADECHGEGSASPATMQFGSESNLGGDGNLTPKKKKKKKKHRRHHRRRGNRHQRTGSAK